MLFASPSNRPSVGLAVVDSMATGQIKAFACHPTRFSAAGPRLPALARIPRRRAVLADRLDHFPMPALFPFHMNRDHRVRRWHQQQDVKNQPKMTQKTIRIRLKIAEKGCPFSSRPSGGSKAART
jgi:hypothetical protein